MMMAFNDEEQQCSANKQVELYAAQSTYLLNVIILKLCTAAVLKASLQQKPCLFYSPGYILFSCICLLLSLQPINDDTKSNRYSLSQGCSTVTADLGTVGAGRAEAIAS